MRVNIYIRKENEAAWNSLADKSGQVNHWLSEMQGAPVAEPFNDADILAVKKALDEARVPTDNREVLFSDGTISNSGFTPKPPDPETGYPCCLLKRPCKHWQWDGVKSLYVNELTGKEKEPDGY